MNCLVAGKCCEALRVAYAAGRQDLVDTTVVPGAAQVGLESLDWLVMLRWWYCSF
jgi:hypothetical protein